MDSFKGEMRKQLLNLLSDIDSWHDSDELSNTEIIQLYSAKAETLKALILLNRDEKIVNVFNKKG